MNDRITAIKSGKLWQVYPPQKPDDIWFEGTKSACLEYVRENAGGRRALNHGRVRLGQVIYENTPKNKVLYIPSL